MYKIIFLFFLLTKTNPDYIKTEIHVKQYKKQFCLCVKSVYNYYKYKPVLQITRYYTTHIRLVLYVYIETNTSVLRRVKEDLGLKH